MAKKHDLAAVGIKISGPGSVACVNWDLPAQELIGRAVEAGEGKLSDTGALACYTGEYTGRSPGDKFIVRDKTTEKKVDWGKVNQPMSAEHFGRLRTDQLAYLEGKEIYARDAFGGADKQNRVSIRVINESAWANLFCRHLFVRPKPEELQAHLPQFTIIHTPGFHADPKKHGTHTGTFVVINFTDGLVLIGGTIYAGEMKKSIFSILNFLYPLRGILPMHCSANVSAKDPANVALFFGLSGTGKTTLSADPGRRLIGDDEHGWGENGVFNFEGGCYAKCINLSKDNEPQIYNAVRDGAVLENVILDADKVPVYGDVSLTENTRAAYPVEFISGALLEGTGGHPKNIIFLTCDAFGVMPPVSRLTPEQAMYHFLSGYTAKVAGTERGMGSSPSVTFSACFGAPFLPLPATTYAEMLGKKMAKHKVNCWLVNTGWSGGGVGTGRRIKLSYTRAMVEAALSGALDAAKFETEPFFGLSVPQSAPNVPAELLNPRTNWADKAAYDNQARDLAARFRDNFKKFETARPDLAAFGPQA